MKVKLPYEYVFSNLKLTWHDISFGIKNGYVDENIAIEFAIHCLATEQENDLILDLSILYYGDYVYDVLEKIVEDEKIKFDQNLSKRKWLYLILKYLYENKDKYKNPLDIVESLYAMFDYPKSISGLISYMPMKGKDLGSKEKNINRLFDNWYNYIEIEQSYFNQKLLGSVPNAAKLSPFCTKLMSEIIP